MSQRLARQQSLIELSAHHNMITDLILHNHPGMKTITLNDNHIAFKRQKHYKTGIFKLKQ